MNAQQIERQLIDWTVAHSGYETNRHYLGMSRISNCPLVLYHEVLNGTVADEMHHLGCYAGYLWERDVQDRLMTLDIARTSPRELVARFDSRFIGHIDAETIDHDLIEIKSALRERFDRIVAEARLPRAHYEQVQMYLYHGDYRRGFVIYVARDVGSIAVMQVTSNKAVQDRLNVKALHVLKAIDAKEPPECECGHCQ